MKERCRSGALKSERSWGKPTCPLIPPQRMRQRRFPKREGDRSWDAKNLHTSHALVTGIAGGPVMHVMAMRPEKSQFFGPYWSSSGFPPPQKGGTPPTQGSGHAV